MRLTQKTLRALLALLIWAGLASCASTEPKGTRFGPGAEEFWTQFVAAQGWEHLKSEVKIKGESRYRSVQKKIAAICPDLIYKWELGAGDFICLPKPIMEWGRPGMPDFPMIPTLESNQWQAEDTKDPEAQISMALYAVNIFDFDHAVIANSWTFSHGLIKILTLSKGHQQRKVFVDSDMTWFKTEHSYPGFLMVNQGGPRMKREYRSEDHLYILTWEYSKHQKTPEGLIYPRHKILCYEDSEMELVDETTMSHGAQ